MFSQPASLDPTFGTNGIVVTNSTPHDEAYNIAMQPDGKIVICGYSGSNGTMDFALSRYNTNGSLDNTFGNNGRVVTQVSQENDVARCVVIQPDGKIIVTGSSDSSNFTVISTVRYLPGGTPDPSFGTLGIVKTAAGSGGLSYGYTAALQPDGKIIVGGNANLQNGAVNIALVRYNSNGTLDPGFGANGIVSADMNNNYDHTFGIALQPDGKIVASVYTFDGVRYRFGVARFNSNGSFDNSFGVGGKIISQVGFDDVAKAITLQADGKIIIAGYTWNPSYTDTDMALARYNTDGSPDTTFGTGGIIIHPNSAGYDYLFSITVQPDGKIIGAGESMIANYADFLLARFNTDGSLDATFNTSGKVIVDMGYGLPDYASAVTLQADGKIVMAGFTFAPASAIDVALARYLGGSLNVGVVDFAVDNNSVFVFPNPVSSNATIEYTLTQDESISIYITDMQGRIVSTVLNNSAQEAGKHTQAFEMPETIAAGNYLLVLSTEKEKISVKITK